MVLLIFPQIYHLDLMKELCLHQLCNKKSYFDFFRKNIFYIFATKLHRYMKIFFHFDKKSKEKGSFILQLMLVGNRLLLHYFSIFIPLCDRQYYYVCTKNSLFFNVLGDHFSIILRLVNVIRYCTKLYFLKLKPKTILSDEIER